MQNFEILYQTRILLHPWEKKQNAESEILVIAR
jgi:hypothetical protein